MSGSGDIYNFKPNLTGAVRPNRLDHDCLTMLAARALVGPILIYRKK